MNVLLVENDRSCGESLRAALEARDHCASAAYSVAEGLEAMQAVSFDCVALELALPDGDGRAFCRTLRANGSSVAILMLSADESVDVKVSGLRAGADDYLSRPFAVEELIARLEALHRRRAGYPPGDRCLRRGDLVLDRHAREVRRAGRIIELSPRELALLEYLMEREGTVATRHAILDRIWGSGGSPRSNVVNVYVQRLRAKLDGGSPRSIIRTVRRSGYRLVTD
jgi:DNA-binding response OmpR family regulator